MGKKILFILLFLCFNTYSQIVEKKRDYKNSEKKEKRALNYQGKCKIIDSLSNSTNKVAQIFSQSSCPNSDFESGTLDGWQGETGFCCPITTSPSGIVSGRHTIMTGTGTDPNTCDVVHVVSPGGVYSARVGNDDVNAEAETLSYNISVTPSSSLFIYKYAVVLQDPGHSQPEQPRFQVKVLNSSGNLIDPICGLYTVVADVGLDGFQTCPNGDVRYRDWTTVGLDLSPYIGQTITIEFKTGDCSQGGHFGYAYVDAFCSPLQISSTYCSGSFSAQLTAPIGFSYLWNTGETTQTINVNNPATGLIYSCTMTSVTGCIVNISTVMQLEDPVAGFTITNTCYNDAIFQDTTVFSNLNQLNNFNWNFGDGTSSTLQNPSHVFTAAGTYTVQYTISNTNGCLSTTSNSITVYDPPTAQINYTQTDFCTIDTSVHAVNLTGTSAYLGGVYSSSPAGLSLDTTNGDFIPSTSLPGIYTVSYQIPTFNGCTPPPQQTTVTVIQSPSATINYSTSTFCDQINALQPISINGIGIYTGGIYSSTPAGLTLDPNTGEITPSSSLPGMYTVEYNLINAGANCSAVNTSTIVTIVAGPTVTLSYASPFCSSIILSQSPALSVTGSTALGAYSSSPSGLNINFVSGNILANSSIPGNYVVSHTLPAQGVCSQVVTNTNVTITPYPTANISYSDPFCISITTTENVSISGTGAYTGGLFSTSVANGINSVSGEIIPNALVPGLNQITYTIPASGGCPSYPVSTYVTINPLPQPVLTDFVICKDKNGYVFRPAILDTGLTDAIFDCQWFLNGTIIPSQTNNIYTANVEGNYSVIVQNNQTGCISLVENSNVTMAESADDFYAYVTNTFDDSNSITVVVQGGTGPYLFMIDDLPAQTSNVFQNLSSGIHTVKVTDVNNCSDLIKDVMVLGYPKFFTPNGDGINENWNIYYYDNIPNAIVYIYDRYGKLLKVQSPISLGWDGTYIGKTLPSTDYWFVVEYYDLNQNGVKTWQTYKAHFAMKR